MANSDILNFTEEIIVDEEIERFEFHEYEPISTSLNKEGEIRITLSSKICSRFHPSRIFWLKEDL